MPVFKGSRYEDVNFTALIEGNESPKKFLHTRTPLEQRNLYDSFSIRSARSKEELDLISHMSGGFEDQWWIIADVNNIEKPWEIKPGTQLIVPTGNDFSLRR